MHYSTRAGVLALALFGTVAATAAFTSETPLIGGAAQAPAFKAAYVNIEALMQVAPGRQKAESTYVKEAQAYQTLYGKLQDSLNTVMEKLAADAPKLTPAEKEKRETAVKEMSRAFQEKVKGEEAKLEKRQAELMAPLEEAVAAVLDEIRVADGLAIIFREEPGASIIAVADKNLDLTKKAELKLKARADQTVKRPGGT